MSQPDPEAIRKYMMRGALTGSAEEEVKVSRYCEGKQDNGKPCRIVMVGDKKFCQRHQKELDALESGAPLEPGRIEREIDVEKKNVGIDALVKVAPPAPVGMLVPFDERELEELAELAVDGTHVRQLVLLGLAGSIVRA